MRLLFLCLLLCAGPVWGAETIRIAGGSYMAAVPAGWDGVSRLPVVVFLHGFRNTPEQVMEEYDIAKAIADAGALCIAPEGENEAWHFAGGPRRGRDDIAFVHEVLADVRARWPTDPTRTVLGGFSIGATMTWEVACHRPEGFAAFLPFAGTFWLPFPTQCEGGAVRLRQVHGVADKIFPIAGRAVGNGQFRQGDSRQAVAFLAGINGCTRVPRREAGGGLDCETWGECGSGRAVQLCLHRGDHHMAGEWMAASLAWAFRP